MEDRPWSACVVLVDRKEDCLAAVGIVALADQRERAVGVTEQPPSMLVHRLPTRVAGFHEQGVGWRPVGLGPHRDISLFHGLRLPNPDRIGVPRSPFPAITGRSDADTFRGAVGRRRGRRWVGAAATRRRGEAVGPHRSLRTCRGNQRIGVGSWVQSGPIRKRPVSSRNLLRLRLPHLLVGR